MVSLLPSTRLSPEHRTLARCGRPIGFTILLRFENRAAGISAFAFAAPLPAAGAGFSAFAFAASLCGGISAFAFAASLSVGGVTGLLRFENRVAGCSAFAFAASLPGK